MKWRVIIVLASVLAPAIVGALRDGKLTNQELSELADLLAGLLRDLKR